MSETLDRPSTLDDLSLAGAGETARLIAHRKVSALEACEAAIARIEARDGSINAVVVRDFERAREAAKAADGAIARGETRPLLGVPMTVKEAMNVAGLPTTWGVAEAKGWIASEDSVGVARLKAAGAVILGKTNVPPHLGDWQSVNPIYGRTRHPLDPERTPGGSSGGSAAALAAGMVPLEFGSDIGGSIRVPSAFCGVFGHKPSWELIPNRGHAPAGADGVSPPLNVVGPMARSAEDLDLALGILAGPEEMEAAGYKLVLPTPTQKPISDWRILVIDKHPLAKVQKEVGEAVRSLAAALSRAGARVEQRSDRLPDLEASHQTYLQILSPIMSRGSPSGVFPPPVDAHAWMAALDSQLFIRRQWAKLFEEFDAVIAPAFGVVAFPHDDRPWDERTHVIDGETTPYPAQVAWPGIATLANLPATALPIGRTLEGLPIGAQIIGPYLGDRTTIAMARAISRDLF
ncbi:MAG: amidase family protein [Caulobacteraceae bacterium]